ncbi:MAG: Flagellar hook protein FlgE [Bacteroidota bacterium]|nr:Flagellar hook protein FlgE [Bacteroidota bacterium]
MGLTSSLTSGASSLVAHQKRMDVISNNIANSNTIGFKSSRVSFAEQFNQIKSYGKSPDLTVGGGTGGMDPMQFGLGVKIGAVTREMQQGVLETTNRPLDMALQGDGFFVYNLNGKQLFSRAGGISRDSSGYLVDSSSGAYLQGYNLQLDANGKTVKDANNLNILNRKVDNLRIPPNMISIPKQTEKVTISGNLNSSTAVGDSRTTSINIFDTQGAARSLGLTFTKTANANEYSISATIDDNAVTLGTTLIQFNNDGTLSTPLSLSITAADLNTAIGSPLFDAATPKNITISLAESDNLLGGLTQFSGPNTATAFEQDGYQSGDLSGLSVDEKGQLWGAFTNGQSEILGQVVISKFTNQEALLNEGGNFFSVSPDSGLPNIGTAGEIFPSTRVAGSTLEQSNVDLTSEFTDMITTQRAFEAASRTITVSDSLLAETNQLKR